MTLCGRTRPKTVSERLGHWDISQQMFPCHLRTDSGVNPVHELFSTKPSNYFACLVSLGNWEAAQSFLHGSTLKLVNLPSPSILFQSPADAPAEANGRVRSRDGNLGVSFPSLEEAVGMDGPTKLLLSCTQSCTKWWG